MYNRSYLIISQTVGRQKQQSQSWESENASHLDRPAENKHLSSDVFSKEENRTIYTDWAPYSEILTFVSPVCFWCLTLGFYTCSGVKKKVQISITDRLISPKMYSLEYRQTFPWWVRMRQVFLFFFSTTILCNKMLDKYVEGHFYVI